MKHVLSKATSRSKAPPSRHAIRCANLAGRRRVLPLSVLISLDLLDHRIRPIRSRTRGLMIGRTFCFRILSPERPNIGQPYRKHTKFHPVWAVLPGRRPGNMFGP
jgi:hypothetical protein